MFLIGKMTLNKAEKRYTFNVNVVLRNDWYILNDQYLINNEDTNHVSNTEMCPLLSHGNGKNCGELFTHSCEHCHLWCII